MIEPEFKKSARVPRLNDYLAPEFGDEQGESTFHRPLQTPP
jgi:hypothetical protein